LEARGRSCPLSYRYQPEALAQPAQLEADTFFVVGGLYGNPVALAAALERAADEPGGPAATTAGDLLDWFGRADVSVLASSHTGLPYAQAVPDGPRRRLVINNGAAGLPNFAGTTYGVVTRLSSNPWVPADSLYSTTVGTLRCDALAVRFDLEAWTARFLAQWLPGSPGHRSYFTRITGGTHLRLEQAARSGVQLTAGR